MLKEFKAFLSRGNVIDLAVAVIIGAAFGQNRHHARRGRADAADWTALGKRGLLEPVHRARSVEKPFRSR